MRRLPITIIGLIMLTCSCVSAFASDPSSACSFSAAALKKSMKASYTEARFLLKTCTDMNPLRIPFQSECLPLMRKYKPQSEALEKRIERDQFLILSTSGYLWKAANHLALCCTCNAGLAIDHCWMAEQALLEYEEALNNVDKEIAWLKSEECPKKK